MEVLLLMMMALYTCNQIRAMGNLVDDESCLFSSQLQPKKSKWGIYFVDDGPWLCCNLPFVYQ
jgi:hypothetical protein